MPIKQPTPIDQLPQPPNPADRSNFNSLAYPFTAAMLPMTEQINQAISDTYNNALEAEAKASEAHNSGLAAQEAETLAEGHKDAAAISAGQAGDYAAAAAEAVHGDFGPAIHTATAKGTPADDDELPIVDSAASWSLKKLTWGNLKAAVFAAFKVVATGSNAKNTLGLGTAATRDVGLNKGDVALSGDVHWVDGVTGIDNTGAISIGWGATPPTFQRLAFTPYTPSFTFGLGVIVEDDGAGSNGAMIAVDSNTGRLYTNEKGGSEWGVERDYIATIDTLSTTGQSTEYPMTQKAVTDALTNAGALAPPSATYEYDAFGRVDKIVTPDGDTVIGYNPDGTVETISYPTGRVETFTYDIPGNVVSMTATGG